MATQVPGQAGLQDPADQRQRRLWVAENLISYDDSPWKFTVNILQFRGDKIAHERLYVMDGFDAAPWRADWAETFDPLEATVPE